MQGRWSYIGQVLAFGSSEGISTCEHYSVIFGKTELVFPGGILAHDMSVLECTGGRNTILASVFARKNNGIDPVIVSGGRFDDRTVKKIDLYHRKCPLRTVNL